MSPYLNMTNLRIRFNYSSTTCSSWAIDDVALPTPPPDATFVWGPDCFIKEYGIEQYKAIMDAEYKILENGNIEIFCDDYALGEHFTMAAAGYIADSEYNKMFGWRE
jgi:hypothetical protein